MQPEKALQPNTAQIRDDLQYMTARWDELEAAAVFEIRAFKENAQPQIAKFSPDWIDEAVDWIENMNRLEFNIYAVRNPIRHDVSGSASDDDILAAFFLWADCDDEQSAGNVYRFDGPAYSAAVVTGNTPGVRVHTYWQLDAPCTDMDQWREMQTRIAHHFKSDTTVVNPSRIMRVGGTVSYPAKHKRERGYVSEVVTIRTEYPEERAPVSLGQMDRVFPEVPPAGAPVASDGLYIDTGSFDRLDVSGTLAAALRGENWNHSVNKIVWRMAGIGATDEEIQLLAPSLTLPGYTVKQTVKEMMVMLRYAREAGNAPKKTPAFDVATDQDDFDTTPISLGDMIGIKPRAWLYGRKLIRGFCTVLVSPGGVGKSAWTAAAAIDMAEGQSHMHDAPHGQLRVWVYNLEDPREESLRKFSAIHHYRPIPDAAFKNIIVSSGRDRSLIVAGEAERGIYVAGPDVERVIAACKRDSIDVLIVDPAVRSHRLPENDNKAVDLMMDQFARIAAEANISVLLVHHTRKGFVAGDMDSMRGASSMGSAARAAFTLQTMSVEEAADLNVPEAERRSIVRMDNAKANLAPPSGAAEWYKLESQNIGNATHEYPDGDFVQVVTAWKPPDPWADIGPVMGEIMDRIERGFVHDDGNTEPFSPAKRAGDRYVANAVLASFPDGSKSEKQAMSVVKHWIEEGFLKVTEYQNRNADTRKGVFVNQNGDPGA